MMKKLPGFLLAGLIILLPLGGCIEKEEAPIGMAVEFTSHAACAYIGVDKGWYEEEGLELTAYESYVTGTALASALARGDIDVAYTCLIPAINAYANAGVPIKIVAGTHKYGYALVVDPDKVNEVKDLEQTGLRIGCVQAGGPVDILLQKTMDVYNLDEGKVLANVQRMNPANQVLAIEMGKLDAAFLPEQWATMAEELGFNMLLMSQDIWPEMQGSVLVVKEDLINNYPELVSKLIRVTQKATDWEVQNPEQAAEVLARQLNAASGGIFPTEVVGAVTQLEITPEVLLKSMSRLEYTTAIDPEMVQQTINYLAELGYIQNSFDAEDILDLSFLQDEMD